MTKTGGDASHSCAIRYSLKGGETAALAASELAAALGAMVGMAAGVQADPAAEGVRITLEFGPAATNPAPDSTTLFEDQFEIIRPGPNSIAIVGANPRALLHGACDLLERLGASFVVGAPARFPRLDLARLGRVEPYRVEPAFRRRALASDIMTWNYTFPDRLAAHLDFDREFIAWMARRGVNAFEYISHAHDTRLRIDELVELYRVRGIRSEYGGHVIQILLPRDRFDAHPEYFPLGENGERMRRGNLCVSSGEALGIVRENALAYLSEYPETGLLHVWGADVRAGAWCRCAQCGRLSPQQQYLKVVNTIASAAQAGGRPIPVAYLAYHDTIEPDPQLKPAPNVCFEWAPRERCYVHAIDERSCATNARYLRSLKRYADIFEGRGGVFEYYADAMLFGALGFASPAVIARDLRAYRRLGIESVSCLTFGAYSALAYPVNLEAFVRGSRSTDFDPAQTIADTAAARHPAHAEAMAQAYRDIERASALTLDYADVMRPYTMTARKVGPKKIDLAKAISRLESAADAAGIARGSVDEALAGAEEELWRYGIEVLGALGDYLRAREERGVVRRTLGEAAIATVAGALEHIRAIAPALKGAWGAWDLEQIHQLWLDGLKRNLAERPGRQEKGRSGDCPR
jgi:Domain of unknown function (DUF4838)